MQYTIYRAPGWHGEPTDPVIETTGDERYAAMRAGCRIDISMPGASNKYDTYAVDENGDRVKLIESFRCDVCGDLTAWGDTGPVGGVDGRIPESLAGHEKHLVTWMCEECACDYEDEDE